MKLQNARANRRLVISSLLDAWTTKLEAARKADSWPTVSISTFLKSSAFQKTRSEADSDRGRTPQEGAAAAVLEVLDDRFAPGAAVADKLGSVNQGRRTA
jgi:hypothetical protein